MADVKISQLPVVPSATLADIFPVVQNLTTYQESLSQVATLLGFNASIILTPAQGGTGVNNGVSTLTLGNNVKFFGNFAAQFNVTGATNVTFPTSGILATTANIPSFPLSVANGGTGVGSASITAFNNITGFSAAGTTGTTSTNLVFSTSPTFVTPILGVASATSLATSAASPLLLTNGQLVTIALTSQTVGASTLTIPNFANVNDTFAFITLAQSLSNKTLVTPVISTGLTASGSTANDFSGSTGTFITSTGANTLSGLVTATNTTDASAGAGSVVVNGGLATLKKIYCATGLTVNAGGVTVNAGANTFTSASAINTQFSGTQTAQSSNLQATLYINTFFQPAASVSSYSAAIGIFPSFNAGSTQTIANAVCAYVSPTSNANAGTITNLFGFYYDGGTAGAATINNSYGLRIIAPNAGSSKYTAYLDSGVGIGVSNAISTTNPALLVQSSNAIVSRVNGTQTGGGGATYQSGLEVNPTHSCSSAITSVQSIRLVPTWDPSSGTITSAAGFYAFPLTGASGTISSSYGMWLQNGSNGGCTVTTATNLRVESPAFGSTKYTAYLDNTVCIGGLSTTYALYVSTDSAGKPGVGGLWTVVSDERVKKNIVDCDDALGKLSQLRVREFEYDDAVCDHINVCKGSKHYGFLAQEYEEVFPEDVKCGNEKFGELEIKDCKAINTGQTSALVIRAIQQLSDKVNLLEAQLGL